MESSHLRQLISAFNSLERKDIRRFLESPYFNQRRDLVLLFDWFCRTATPEKESAKQHLFGAGEVPDQELRLRMSYLSRLIERYLAQKEFEALDTEVKLRALTGMRRRGLDKHFEKMRRNIEISLENSPLRDSTFHESHFRLHWEKYQMQYAVKQTELDSLQAASQAADVAYLAQKLRLICLSAAYKMVYSMEDQAIWEKEILAFAEQHVAQTHPAISIYLHCYRMLSNPAEEVHFHAFKAMLLDSGPVFSAEERRGLFIWAINYCVRRINAGEKTYSREVSDLYKAGLSSGVLLENGSLTPYIYSNVVASGLQTGDLEWVGYFIHQYKNSLEKQHRESAFSFNLARLEFARRRFRAVLELLQKANYRDPLLNLSAKTLLLKTWFELGEHDILQSHLDAMRNYINRKRILGYHRTNAINIIKHIDKILKTNPNDAAALERIRAGIMAEEVLSEREWLLMAMDL